MKTPHAARTRTSLWLLLICAVVLPSPVAQIAAAQEYSLSLREALGLAREHGFDVRRAQADYREADAGVSSARSAFFPHVSVSGIATTTNDPLSAFGFKLRQRDVALADLGPDQLNNPDRTDNFGTRFEIRQPVLNADGFLAHAAARSQAQAAASGLERASHQMDYQVKQKYYELVLAHHSLAVIDSALVAARANRRQASRFFEQGIITRADLLEADVRVLDLESRQTATAFAVRNASDALRYLLGMDEARTIVPTDLLEMPVVHIETVDITQVNDMRSDMMALRFRSESAEKSLRASRMRFLPSLNLIGGYELNDRTVFGFGADSWMVGAVLRWNLFAGFEQIGGVERARARVLSSKIAYESQALKNHVEIDAARRGVEQTRQQIALARKAVNQARESLRIRTDRYAQGLEKTTDVLEAEVTLANQRLMYLQTLYSHYVNIFRLELLIERPLL